MVARFEDGPFGDRAPHAVEAPFALVLASQVVRGRIDEASYALSDASAELASYLASLDADPARLEWIAGRLAELQGLARSHPEGRW